MNAPLSLFLMEFSAAKPVAIDVVDAFEPVEATEPDIAVAEPTVTLTVEAFEAQVAEARRQAADDEHARVSAELTARFDEERATMLQGFEAARESWANEQGQQINASLTAAIEKLETELSTCLAAALKPLFSEACRTRMLSEMGVALAAILGDPSHPPVRIEGPADLLTAFGTAHGSDIAIDYVVSEQAELTIITDSTRVETRLAACLAAFQSSEG